MIQAEELIKEEMITMLHYDALHDPLPNSKISPPEHQAFLREHSYERFTEEEMEQVYHRLLLFNPSTLVAIYQFCVPCCRLKNY